jgi:hypothetical protein
MPRHLVLELIALCVVCAGAWAATPPTFYVTTQGNDVWSGKLPAPNKAGTDGPVATLQRALVAINELKAVGNLPHGARVLVAAGTYYLYEPLAFGPSDGGLEGGEIVFAAVPGAKVYLKGSVPITGWTLWRDGIYRASVPPEALAGGRFWQLYYQEQRQVLARFPNADPQHPRSGGFVYVPQVVEKESKTLLAYSPDRLHPDKWARPQDVRVHIWSWLNWNRNIVNIKSVDADKHVITLASPCSYMISKGNRFFIENALEELDAPGEWYLDVAAKLVYFRPPDGKEPGANVSVPVLQSLISFRGRSKPDLFASHVRLSGFDLSETRGSLVTFSLAEACTLSKSNLHNCGGSAVVMERGAHHNVVRGCDIAHVGGTAITLSDVRDWTRSPEGKLHHNVIDNNHVHDVGEYGDAWGAIRFDPSCGGNGSYANVVSHNLVHDTPRQGISFNGMGNIVEYNHVHHTNQEQSDTGAIGMGSRDIYERGSIIRYNYVHDTGGYNMVKPGVWEYPHYCWGIYLDDYTSGVHVYGNLVVRTYLGGVMIHGGQDNLVENNIIVDGQSQQIQYAPIDSLTSGRTPGHPDEKSMWLMTGNRCVRNIFAYTDPKAQLARGSKWQQAVAESDYNLIWHGGEAVAINLPNVTDGDFWAAWRKLGFDVHSVIADPKFRNPKQDDYRLQPGSPALKLGFKPLPHEKMGLYKSPDRVTWPVDDDPWREEHIRYPEGDPALAPPTVRTNIPTLKAVRRASPPVIDGQVEAPEWNWTPELTATVAALSMGDGNGKQPSRALVSTDAEALYVALVNQVSDGGQLITSGGVWGQDDGAEICLQDVSGPKAGPIFIVQGFPSGKHESKIDAGAPPAAALKLGQAVTYAATIGPSQWTGEWRIPFAAMGVDPQKAGSLLFNIGVLKKAEREWIAWVSTGGAPWHMELAGKLLLQ